MTAGNRTGLKMYSFNTTVRMPDKNIEFLELFKKYEGTLFDDAQRTNYYIEAIKTGIVKPMNMTPEIREKIRRGEDLTSDEIKEVLQNNRPRNGFGGRVGDFMSAMASQGFLQKQGKRYRLTNLGNELLTNPENETDIYIKAMINLQYGSIDRNTATNKAIPFLNMIFVMTELEKYYETENLPYKGISDFELGTFVFTMKDYNYKKSVKDILKYREINGGKTDYEYAMKYIHEDNGILAISESTLKDYTDEVLRKFKKTGLFIEDKQYKKSYYRFSPIEEEKIRLLIDNYSDYKWLNYTDADEYFNRIESYVLPWEADDSLYAQILRKKAEIVGLTDSLDKMDKKIRDEIESKYNDYIFQNSVLDDFNYDLIIHELEMINGKQKGNSILPDTENYVKLEWFTSLLLSKKFGKISVKSNLKFYDDGTPKCCAAGGEADIEFYTPDINYNIEVTTISNKNQQVNNETTSVLRHLDETNRSGNGKKTTAIMVAPYIHYDTINIYKISANGISKDTIAVPLTIDAFIKTVQESDTYEEFDQKVNVYCELMKSMQVAEFERMINEIKLNEE